MPNMLTYARENMYSFAEKPFNEVDSLILSWLSYLRFECLGDLDSELHTISIRDLLRAEKFEELTFGVKSAEETIELLTAVVASPRFRQIRLTGYSHENSPGFENSKQFAAITYILDEESIYIAFRGTDCSLVGWKEDFNLALSESVPSQLLALAYVNRMINARALSSEHIYIGGHSKGGNMAVYAAAHLHSSLQERIEAIFSHDGPGFLKEDLEYPGYIIIQDKIKKTLPKSSLFGLIFDQEAEYAIVESDSVSVGQHNPMYWHVEGDSFVHCEELTPDAKILYKKINNWIMKLSVEDRKRFIDGIFSVLEKTGAKSFDEFGADLKKNIPIVIKSVADMDHETQFFLIQTLLRI